IEYRLSEGDPAVEIIRLAAEVKANLIVMGTHGRTGLGRLMMGSVAEAVLRRAPCPVLTLKAPFSWAPGCRRRKRGRRASWPRDDSTRRTPLRSDSHPPMLDCTEMQ